MITEQHKIDLNRDGWRLCHPHESETPRVGDMLFNPRSGEIEVITDASDEGLIQFEFDAMLNNFGWYHCRKVDQL